MRRLRCQQGGWLGGGVPGLREGGGAGHSLILILRFTRAVPLLQRHIPQGQSAWSAGQGKAKIGDCELAEADTELECTASQ